MALFKKVKSTHYIGLPFWPIFVGLFIVIFYFVVTSLPILLNSTILWAVSILIFLVPPILLAVLWIVWRQYVRAQYIGKQESVLLEFKVPQHILKTPRAMEQIFNGLHIGPGESTFIARWWNGKVRPWWSLEFVSIEGNVHMYIWTWKQFRSLIETQFYSQYPNIEIHEVPDYTDGVYYDKKENNAFGVEFELTKADVYPIKTYIDMELDKDAKKAEQIVDPISGVFEKLSMIGVGEVFWYQILIRQNKGAKKRDVFWFSKSKEWKEEVKEEIEKIYENAKPKKSEDGGVDEEGYPMLKPGEINAIKALERSIDKPGFDAGIRGVYIAREDKYDGTRIAAFLSIWNSFNSGSLNGFKPSEWHVSLDYPWEDIGGRTSAKYAAQAIDAYKRRSFFHPPYERARYVLTSEELATIFHFPSEEAKAPGFERMQSTRSEPPLNLPI